MLDVLLALWDLVASVNDANASLLTRDEDRWNVTSDQREHELDTVSLPHTLCTRDTACILACTLSTTAGLADLNRADFNHWFKSWLKSNDFFVKKSCDLNHNCLFTTLPVRAKQTILNTSTCTVWSYSSIHLFNSVIMSLRQHLTHSPK